MKYSAAAHWRLFSGNKVAVYSLFGRNYCLFYFQHLERAASRSLNLTLYERQIPCLSRRKSLYRNTNFFVRDNFVNSSCKTKTRQSLVSNHVYGLHCNNSVRSGHFAQIRLCVRKYCDSKDTRNSVNELCCGDLGANSKTGNDEERRELFKRKRNNLSLNGNEQNPENNHCDDFTEENGRNETFINKEQNLLWELSESSMTKDDVKEILFSFCYSKEVKQAAKQQGLGGSMFFKSMKSFMKDTKSDPKKSKDLHHTLKRIHSGEDKEESLLPFLLNHAKQLFPSLAQEDELRKISDLSGPASLYTRARKIKRKIVYHVGPTNSGKTHAALESFGSSHSGIYCAPLRLLAAEVFRKTNNSGVNCDLVTGEERQYAVSAYKPASHVACTVEMCNTFSSYDCAVIDEIQMVGDRDRGWAWTRAFLGLVCPEVHVCGEETAVDLISRLAKSCGDNIEIRRYNRLTPLKVLHYSLGDFSQVKPGDCIVAFSQKQLFRIRESIEQTSGYKCAIVYGGLPPATRTEQARRFNDPDDEHCVMVASDAIGMGLNLNIKRLIFSTLEKFDGQSMTELSISQTKQIAGRAGRFGTEHSVGEVTTFHKDDLRMLKHLLNLRSETVTTAGMAPTLEQIQLLSHQLPNSTLSTLFDVFTNMAQLDGDCYFMCDLGEKKFLAELTDNIPLSIRDQYTFCQAPISLSSKPIVLSLARKFAWLVSRAEELSSESLETLIPWPPFRPRSLTHLQELGALHEVFDIYLWLSYRFEHVFVDYQGVQAMQQTLENVIGKAVSSNLGIRSKYFSSGESLYKSRLSYGYDPSRVRRSEPAAKQRSVWFKQTHSKKINKQQRRSLKGKTFNKMQNN